MGATIRVQLILGLLLLGHFASPVAAQEVAPAAPAGKLQEYRSRELTLGYSMWAGRQLYRGGEPLSFGAFGGNGALIFAGAPAAEQSVRTFRRLRISGFVLYVVGLATLLTEIVLLETNPDLFVYRGTRPEFWAMLIPGCVAAAAGGILMGSAEGYVTDAVRQYNDDLARRIESRGAALPAGRSFGIALRRTF